MPKIDLRIDLEDVEFDSFEKIESATRDDDRMEYSRTKHTRRDDLQAKMKLRGYDEWE